MPVEEQLPENAPIIQAWRSYQQTNDYANARQWAATHTDGSLWVTFLQGWLAKASEGSVEIMEDKMNVGHNRLSDKPLSRFRKMYRPLTDAEKVYHDNIKDQAAKLEYLINGLGVSRELSLALKALEDTVMRAVRDLTSDRRAYNNSQQNGKEKITDADLLNILTKLPEITAD